MIRKFLVSVFAVFAIASVTVLAEDIKLDGVKCVVAPRPVSADKSAEYKDGKVFFCCGNCAGKFAEDSKKFATTANMQLVATKQYEQKACPLSGGPLNADTEIKVGEAKVSFCCNNCKGKVESTQGKDQLELVYGDKAFEKAGFAKVATK